MASAEQGEGRPGASMPIAPAPPSRLPGTRLGGAASEDVQPRLRACGDGEPVVIITSPPWWVVSLITLLLPGMLAFGAIAVYRTMRNVRDRAQADSPAPAADTLFTPPSRPRSTPTTTPPTLPTGATSLFAVGAAEALAPLLDQGAPGDPTRFTSIVLYPDHAETVTLDPNDPAQTVHTTWRPTGRTYDGSEHENVDISNALFTIADVNWTVISGLVIAAPRLTGLDGHAVTSVVVQRWGFDPAFPMRILVYVDDTKLVEATTDGQVLLAVH